MSQKPPHAPQISRQIDFYPHQLLGVGGLILILILLAFLFKNGTQTVLAENALLQLEVTFPKRARFEKQETITIQVHNLSSEEQKVSVQVDENYLSAFSDLNFIPSAQILNSPVYEVDLGTLAPQEGRAVQLELKAEQLGRVEGFIKALTSRGSSTEVSLHTFNFP